MFGLCRHWELGGKATVFLMAKSKKKEKTIICLNPIVLPRIMASYASHQDQKQESRDEDELKKDQFDRLTDHLVMLIINKLICMETLLRFSLVSERYFSLVYQTDSISLFEYLELDDRRRGLISGLLRYLAAKFRRASTPNRNLSESDRQQKYCALTHFKQIKRLHRQRRLNFSYGKDIQPKRLLYLGHILSSAK